MSDVPDLKKFLSDPSFQTDRDFLDGYFANFLERQAKIIEEKRRTDEVNEPKNIFDRLFGGR